MIAGLDLSTRAIDCALIHQDTGELLELHRWPLVAVGDAFDRSRWVRDSMPSRGWWIDKGVIAVGIEDPAGKHGVRDVARVQGGVLQCIPVSLLVYPLAPSQWRKLNGLPGNAPKHEVLQYALRTDNGLTQDEADAILIARATLALLDTRKAA